MRKLIICAFFVLCNASNSYSETIITEITFDRLRTGSRYIENCYLFQGYIQKSDGLSSSASPVARIYGNNPVTISRVDGLPFTLSGFDVVYRRTTDTPWRIDNQSGSGFPITRSGEFDAGEFPTNNVTNVNSLRISDPAFRSTVYYEFDNFIFTHNTNLPESVDGDINMDGSVNVADILLGQLALIGTMTLTDEQLEHGDVAPLVCDIPSPDGLFTLADLFVIARKALGLIDF